MEYNESELKTSLGAALGIPASMIGEDTSVDTVSGWDSLKHMTLVLALEDKFGISFSEEQTVEILNYPLIKTVLLEHGVRFVS